MTKKLIIPILTLALLVTVLPFNAVNLEAASSQKIENVRVRESSTTVQIIWQTNKRSTVSLFYGRSANIYETSVVDNYSTYDHSVTLKALERGTTYYYKIVADNEKYEGSFQTLGTKPQLTVYQPYFVLLFDNAWENINGKQPSSIGDLLGLDFNVVGFKDSALRVTRPNSYLQYSCSNDVFHPAYGSVTAWISFDRFDKSAVIWQTDNSQYALYYEVGGSGDDFDKRIVARAGFDEDGNYAEAEYIIDPDGSAVNKWNTNEWHFLTLTWEGSSNGQLQLFIDGRRVDTTSYEDISGCSSFRVGNNYQSDNKFFSIGKIDELKVHQWAMNANNAYSIYSAYSYSPNFEKPGVGGSVAGYSIRTFKDGKILKAPDGKIYVISRGKRMHISDENALSRFGSHPVINVSWDEIGQYEEGDTFYSWSRYPDCTLLKAYGKPAVYWVWDGRAGLIANEATFLRYNNAWEDIVEISQSELDIYPAGTTYK